MIKKFPFIFQHDAMDCGPACVAMISKFYGKNYPLQYLRDMSFLTREGVSLSGLSQACENIGFESMAITTKIEEITEEKENPLPCILFWNNAHFVVLYDTYKNIFTKKRFYKIADPASGLINIPEDKFIDSWANSNNQGVAFLINPTEKFYSLTPPKESQYNFKLLSIYIFPHKKEFFRLFFGLGLGSLLTLVFPFLTQYLIDKGVAQKNISIVFILLIAQLSLFIGSTVIEIVRNWLVIYIGAKINIHIITDFFKKVLRLPLKFFDTKFTGDFYQRIQDHSRIENFLTSQSITTLFSLINFSVFFIVLLRYDVKILSIYITLTILSILWSNLFLKKREKLDYFRFKSSALNQQAVNEMIFGIQDIKLNNFEDFNIDNWQKVQKDVFEVNFEILKIDQLQLIGFDFINQLKNIIITFISAREVILGNISLGSLLSISYIIGQMNSPINQLITFFRSLQDAQLSMKRLTEVQNHKEEETSLSQAILYNNANDGIHIKNLSYQYEGPQSPFVLKNINVTIPHGKTTAIVGASGSGKTTLMKLLLQFYDPITGDILINKQNLSVISPYQWRESCGVVMQDGYIFSESIERNIATKEVDIDNEKLNKAIRIANIKDYIEGLPNKEKTMIGNAGNGVSGGEKQRILLARAVYKEPKYIFLDEATSSLDAKNERLIHEELLHFFKDKTVVIIAHRLSTIKNADQIVVLDHGEIVEVGNHISLLQNRGYYYDLVHNQLSLQEEI